MVRVDVLGSVNPNPNTNLNPNQKPLTQGWKLTLARSPEAS